MYITSISPTEKKEHSSNPEPHKKAHNTAPIAALSEQVATPKQSFAPLLFTVAFVIVEADITDEIVYLTNVFVQVVDRMFSQIPANEPASRLGL